MNQELRFDKEGKMIAQEWKPNSEPIFLRLDTISQIRSKSSEVKRIILSTGQEVNISSEEAEEIKKALLSGQKKDTLSEEVSHLTAAVRDLWNLLRARMH